MPERQKDERREIDRFVRTETEDGKGHVHLRMKPQPLGAYVRYSDHLEERKRLEAERDKALKVLRQSDDDAWRYWNERKQAEAQRDEALKEAKRERGWRYEALDKAESQRDEALKGWRGWEATAERLEGERDDYDRQGVSAVVALREQRNRADKAESELSSLKAGLLAKAEEAEAAANSGQHSNIGEAHFRLRAKVFREALTLTEPETKCVTCGGSETALRQGNGEWLSEPCPDCTGKAPQEPLGCTCGNWYHDAPCECDKLRAAVEDIPATLDAAPEDEKAAYDAAEQSVIDARNNPHRAPQEPEETK